MVKLPKNDAPNPTDVLELVRLKKLLMQCHVRGGHLGKTSMKAFMERKGCPSWIEDIIDELQCDSSLEFSDQPGPPPLSLLRPPKLWQCCGIDPFELSKGNVKWLLTWKIVPDLAGSTRRAKARLIVLAFQNPWLTELNTAAPTVSRLAKICSTALLPSISLPSRPRMHHLPSFNRTRISLP